MGIDRAEIKVGISASFPKKATSLLTLFSLALKMQRDSLEHLSDTLV